MSVGQDEDDKAFEEWAEGWLRNTTGYTGKLGPAIERYPNWTRELRVAFDAGMKRGLEKRGCCHQHDPETVAVAVAREAEDAI